MSEIHLAKAASIQRSVARARQECAAAGERFSEDLTRQDAAVLNVLRACETISRELAERLQKMVGFRNVAVHRYRDLDVVVLVSVIRNDLEDLLRFAEGVARQA